MKRKITKILAAFALLVFMTPGLAAWGQTVSENDVLWTEPFTGDASSSSTFSETTSWDDYINPTTFVASDATLLSYTSSKAMASISSNATNMDGVHVWLNKSVDSYIQISGIKLYNTTKVKISWAQATSGSSTTVYYQFDGTGDFTALSTCSGPNANFESSELSVANHTTIALKFFHPSNNAKNTRIDNLTLTATEVSGGTPTCATPTFSPAEGTYLEAKNVTISTTTEGAAIYYTINGDDPTTNSSVYSSAITVSATTTIKAMAVKEGCNNSAVASATYTISSLEHAGTAADPYTVADARTAIDAGVGVSNVYATGIVSEIIEDYNSQYSNITFDLVDEEGSTVTLRAYRCGGDDAANVTVGDIALVSGNLTLYNGIYEFASGCQLVSLTHPQPATITLNPTSIDLGNSNATGEQITKTFTVSQLNLTAGITLSLEGDGDIDITSIAMGAEPTTVTWTYTPTAAGSINATITATSAGVEDQTITISGTAFAPVTGYSIDFESEASLYTDWTFTNMTSKQTGNSNVSAHSGTYYGTTGGKATASVATKTAVATPYLLTCYVTKQTTNTSESTWYIQVSEDGTSWTDIASKDATTMVAGTWDEFSADLSEYTNVYVRVYYTGSTAVRNIDDLTLSTEAPAVLAPTFSPVAGTYNEIQNVTITCATEGATIYYTTDGTTPTNESEEYTEAITVSETTTIKAIAYVDTESSAVATAEYIINLPSVATPTFNPAAGTYTEAQSVTIICETEGASILYKLTENGEWQAYTTAITISETTTVWAKATKAGFNDSEVATATYTIAEPITSGTGTINFGNNGTKINGASVTGTDNLNNTWTITTVGTTSFTQNSNYSQVGSSSKPATSITFTTTLPAAATVSAFEAKFGGFSGTAGDITLLVGETTVGIGSLNAANDVVVESTTTAEGTVLTVTVTDIAKGVKCYYISYTLEEEVTPTDPTITVTGYGDTDGGYVLIASPTFEYADPMTIGMATGNYDLYYYDAEQDLEWRNYKAQDGGNYNLEPGKGYLYANQETVTITFTGTLNPSFTDVGLPYAENDVIKSLYLAGNSSTEAQTFYVFDEDYNMQTFNYLTMNGDGNGFISNQTTSYTAPAMTGFFVQAPGEGVFLSTYDINAKANVSLLNINVLRDRGSVIDNAIVSFSNGSMMDKFYLKNNTTRVYIPQNNREMAVVRSAAEAEMPVSFKASENGTYTLAIEAENVEMNYLHLIDNLTGMDVDLLQTPSYTFEAKTSDYASRFRLVFKANGTNENNAETFAYFNGTNWTVSNVGDATLQVVDVTGRTVSSETINGNATISLNQTPGVYMLRLVNGNSVKVQKVVVR